MCAAGTLPQGLHKLYVATRHLLRELRAKFIRRSYRRVAPAEELPIAPRPPVAVWGLGVRLLGLAVHFPQ